MTAYDIYATLRDLAYLPGRANPIENMPDERNAIPTRFDVMKSLFYDVVPRNRSCEQAGFLSLLLGFLFAP